MRWRSFLRALPDVASGSLLASIVNLDRYCTMMAACLRTSRSTTTEELLIMIADHGHQGPGPVEASLLLPADHARVCRTPHSNNHCLCLPSSQDETITDSSDSASDLTLGLPGKFRSIWSMPNAMIASIANIFQGSGKTTLLQHILRSEHGLRIAVIVNDIGA